MATLALQDRSEVLEDVVTQSLEGQADVSYTKSLELTDCAGDRLSSQLDLEEQSSDLTLEVNNGFSCDYYHLTCGVITLYESLLLLTRLGCSDLFKDSVSLLTRFLLLLFVLFFVLPGTLTSAANLLRFRLNL
jgi:hypothetical protein